MMTARPYQRLRRGSFRYVVDQATGQLWLLQDGAWRPLPCTFDQLTKQGWCEPDGPAVATFPAAA